MRRSPLLPRHEAAGAPLSPDPDHPTPLTFGDVPAEYAAGVQGCALFDRSDRTRLAVRGPDAGEFLHRILANRVRGLEPGDGNANLLLTPKGKVVELFDLAKCEDGFELSCEPGRAAALATELDRFLFTEDVVLEERSDDHAPLELRGPNAIEVARSVLGADLPTSDGTTHRSATLDSFACPVVATALPVLGAAGLRLDAGPDGVEALWDALVAAGARPCGLIAGDSLRVEAIDARPGIDVDDGIYPQEARLERAFSLEKGCYVGQEVVAKIDTYGGLNKRLMALAVDGDDPVPRGTRLWVSEEGDARDLGVVTSWAYSFARDGGMCLGYVKRRHQEPGTVFSLGETGLHASIVETP